MDVVNMTSEDERHVLEKYATVANNKVLSSLADLDPKDKVMSEMLAWCNKQGDIVVLKSGHILSSNPSSRSVQNCKIILQNKGIRPKKIIPATSELVQMLLANATGLEIKQDLDVTDSVSAQQQRLRTLVKDAIQAHATDIHIEVREDIARIRFRKHGELYVHAEWLPHVGREVASVAFNKETDHSVIHFNPLIPQNASMPLNVDGSDVRLRLASLPAHGGFDLVMRVLTAGDVRPPSLAELGYTQQHIELIERAVRMPHGAVLVAGPTGSGKTTTLASCMQKVPGDRKVYTIEDPIEKIIENATQVPVNTEKEDRSFASMGRAALRMDPDVIVLGEMRDEDTARVLIRASITGHLVFSTLHTNTATGIITRLADMGISPVLLGDSNLLVCLMFQRLVPVLCEKCAIPIDNASKSVKEIARWQAVFKEDYKNLLARGESCKSCRGTGIARRTVVAEVIWVDEIGRQFIQKGDTLNWEKHLKANGWQSYKDHAEQLVRQGLCDPEDVEKVVGEFQSIEAKTSFNYRNMT
jgi:type II secretory ATPase GspE/PulE/Tfp pilus assembly ATPase PilB-like protein